MMFELSMFELSSGAGALFTASGALRKLLMLEQAGMFELFELFTGALRKLVKEKFSPMLPHSVLCASMPSVLVFVSEKSQGGIKILFELLVKGDGTDPTHPVAGKLKLEGR